MNIKKERMMRIRLNLKKMYIEITRREYKIEIHYFGPKKSEFKRYGVQKAEFICRLYVIVYKNIRKDSNQFLYIEPDYVEEEMDEPEFEQHLILLKQKREMKVKFEKIEDGSIRSDIFETFDTKLRDKLPNKDQLYFYMNQERYEIDDAYKDTFLGDLPFSDDDSSEFMDEMSCIEEDDPKTDTISTHLLEMIRK